MQGALEAHLHVGAGDFLDRDHEGGGAEVGVQNCQRCQVLEFWLATLKLRSAFLGWKSKGANIFVLRAPYLASFVIRTLVARRHVGTEQNVGRASSRLPRLPSFGVLVGNLEVVIGRKRGKGRGDGGDSIRRGSRCSRCSCFGVFVERLEVVIGPNLAVRARHGRWFGRRSFGYQRAPESGMAGPVE